METDTDAVVEVQVPDSSVAPTDSQSQETAVDTEAVAVATPVDSTEPEAGSDIEVEPVGDDRLRIVVHADTWADVKDSNNFQLEYNLLRAGSTIEFIGQAPFSVFLGNGHGVEVQFNGEPVGFTARIRDDNTARLDVGG